VNSRRNKLVVIGFLVVGVVLLGFGTSRLRPRRLERPELHRHPGLQWLSWTATERESFVHGYLGGYGVGASDACRAADDLFELDKPHLIGHDDVRSTFPSARCLESVFKNVKFSSSTGSDVSAYTTPITEFYAKHPEQSDTSVLMLLETLKGGEKLR
jgi:hypothetical protein